MELIVISALLVVGAIFCYFISNGVSSKAENSFNLRIHALESQIEQLKETNSYLKNDISKLLTDNRNLADAMSKWEILSYERMTDMIFTSYMATKSPETSGGEIIAAIERRTKTTSNGEHITAVSSDLPKEV